MRRDGMIVDVRLSWRLKKRKEIVKKKKKKIRLLDLLGACDEVAIINWKKYQRDNNH